MMVKGPVRFEEEKSTIEAKAGEIVGKDKVTSLHFVMGRRAA
jgi:hypothetical protein